MSEETSDCEVYMLLGQGGQRESGKAADPDRHFVIFVLAADLEEAKQQAWSGLIEKNWHEVELLRGGPAGPCPEDEPLSSAWREAEQGRRGIVIYAASGS